MTAASGGLQLRCIMTLGRRTFLVSFHVICKIHDYIATERYYKSAGDRRAMNMEHGQVCVCLPVCLSVRLSVSVSPYYSSFRHTSLSDR